MGNCCSTASDTTGLIPNEQFDRDIIIYDKEYDPKKPKKRHFKFSGVSITSKKRSEAKEKRNPATGEKNPSIDATPSPQHSEIETVAFSNPSFKPSTPAQEDSQLISTDNNVNEVIEENKASNDIKEVSEENNNDEFTACTDSDVQIPEETDQHVTMRKHFPRDDVIQSNRPNSLPVALPTLREDTADVVTSTISPAMSPGIRKSSVPPKGKPRKGYDKLPKLEFKKFLLKETPSYENEFSPIVSDVLKIKGATYDFALGDLKDVNGSNCLGSGGFGVVSKMKHIPSGCVMAVKRVQIRVDVSLNRELAAMDEGRKKGSPFIVEYYGSIKHDGEVWIAMELMKGSMDKIKIKVYDEKKKYIPEDIIKHVSYSICAALHFLKKELELIHRDVKPSNMLVGEDGSVKICDFGISGPLIESKAKSKEKGCRPYMAPERLDPNIRNYTVQVDVWSFGISVMELMTGVFPYESTFSSYFEQYNEIVLGEPPQMQPNGRYSEGLLSFINPCLSKDWKKRPTFDTLLTHNFLYDYDLDTSKRITREWLEEMNL
ncbi:Mitogen-activated protein kinase kinase 4 (MKK4) [Oopsacas minuta]|uniref:mitogen-activated protein kinase kinase n=1 Tax=Oopsacas minuta TaxID=111878 RepID=A0AAV7KDU5_9METZ|nr:Mitogen-activated protein kinase kinase 4 (MKK4) [Oopsacas minuta]